MPSTTSNVVSVVFDSSAVITPSPPTLSIASATSSPIAGSLCAEIVATWAFSLRVPTSRDILRSASMAAFAPRSSPRFRSIALAPATTLRTPSAKIVCARMVEVLVPSPTASPVFSAAWRNTWAPRFSSGSFKSNSLAMVTPSLQTIGDPQFFWINTDFDFGPNVTRTASQSCVAPRKIFSRAAERNRTCLCATGWSSLCGPQRRTRHRGSAPNETEFVDYGLEMRPFGQRPEFGMRVTVTSDQRRDLAGLVEILDAEQVEIIPRPADRVAADPMRRRAGDPDMIHDPTLEIFDRGRRLQAVRLQPGQHRKS